MKNDKLIEIFQTALPGLILDAAMENYKNLLGSQYKADIVIYPQSVDELMQVVKLANEHQIALYPVGSGTKFKNAVGAFKEGVLISTKKLNRIIEYRPDNMSVEVEAGMLVKDLQELLAEDNIFYPVEDQFASSTIGGQVSANYPGRKKYMYKSARFYVMGLEFISPQGELIRVGGKTVKNVSGYDVSQLLAGSWGILGIITKVTLRVKPIPRKNTQLEYVTGDCNRITEMIASLLKENISLASLVFKKIQSEYLLQLELEGFEESLQLQADSLKAKYKFKDREKIGIEVNNYAKAVISLPLNNYGQGLKEIEALKNGPGLIKQGNITNGMLELNNELLNDELLTKLTEVINNLQGSLIYQGQKLNKRQSGMGSLKILRNLKSIVDPNNILVPQSLALKE